MENRNTLRSQTVRCAHCGEYYSVTYDYCPFCDAGRKEAEKKSGSLFNTLFGAPEEEKKKRPSSEHSRREGGRRPRPEEGRGERPLREARPPREDRPPREERPLRGERPAREERPHGERKRRREEREEKRRERRPRRETPVEDELPRRKKTSEMTEAERAANRAEREARAAQRKRERERAAAEAEARERARQAEQAILARQQQAAGGESMGPVFETMTPPESFGFDTDAGSAPAPVEEGYETTHTGMTFRTFNIPLKGVTGPIPGVTEAAQEASQEVPAPPPAPAEGKKKREPEGVLSEEEASSWAALRSLEDTGGTVVEVTDDTSALVPAGDKPAAQETEAPAQEQPVQEPPAQEQPVQETPVQEAPAEAVQPAADQGAKAPEAQKEEETEKVIPIQPHVQETKSTPPAAPEVQPEAAQAEPAAEPADPEQDLDALLNEIREMIANSPVPSLEELEEKEAEAAPVSGGSGEEVSEPTIVRTVYPPAQGEAAQGQGEEATRPWKTEPAAPEEETAEPELPPDPDEEALEERDTAVSFSLWKKKEKAEPAEAAEEQETGNVVQLQPKKKRNPLPVILSLVVIAAAVFIVAGRFVPSLQGGVIGSFFSRFSQGQTGEDTAQTFTLKQNDLLFTEKGKTETLTPVFAPEGTTAVLGWSSSNPQVATVDENGLVTTVGPGTATITASMSSGESAQCIIRCNWKGGGEQQEDAETPAEGQQAEGQGAAQGAVALSAERVTIDAPGDSKQLTLNGAAGEVTWSSSANTVATVSAEGLITAVSVGGATITATCDGQTYTCEVRCIW